MKEQTQYLKTEISTLQSEVSGDYILPDSYPDVKNILSCSARICDVKKYFGANEGEISGNFAYNIMFSAADDNGGDVICSVSFTMTSRVPPRRISAARSMASRYSEGETLPVHTPMHRPI